MKYKCLEDSEMTRDTMRANPCESKGPIPRDFILTIFSLVKAHTESILIYIGLFYYLSCCAFEIQQWRMCDIRRLRHLGTIPWSSIISLTVSKGAAKIN